MNVTMYVLPIGVVNINTGKTMYDWSIYDHVKFHNTESSTEVALTSQGFLLYCAGGSLKVDDTFVLRNNDTLRKLKEGSIIDVCTCTKDVVLEMLAKHGYHYKPLKAFKARPKGNRKLTTSYSVKGIELLKEKEA